MCKACTSSRWHLVVCQRTCFIVLQVFCTNNIGVTVLAQCRCSTPVPGGLPDTAALSLCNRRGLEAPVSNRWGSGMCSMQCRVRPLFPLAWWLFALVKSLVHVVLLCPFCVCLSVVCPILPLCGDNLGVLNHNCLCL